MRRSTTHIQLVDGPLAVVATDRLGVLGGQVLLCREGEGEQGRRDVGWCEAAGRGAAQHVARCEPTREHARARRRPHWLVYTSLATHWGASVIP